MLLRRRILSSVSGKIFGIQRDYTSSSPVWTRTDDSEGFTFSASVGTTTKGASSFDNQPIYKDIKRVTLDTGDVMVQIPKFYFERKYTGNIESIRISNKKQKGFSIHPLFYYDGIEHDMVYMSAYETISGHYSKSGSAPLVNTTRAGFRTGAANKGNGWTQDDIAAWSAREMLILVEIANNNSQSMIGNGNSNTSAAINTGGSNTMYNAGYITGTAGSSGNTNSAVVWRGIENPWGNVWTWVDGLNTNGTAYYINTQPWTNYGGTRTYADDTSTNYTGLSYNSGSTSYYTTFITREGLDTANPWCIMPTAASGGGENTFWCDKTWSASGWRVCEYGGGWAHGSGDGLFAVVVDLVSSHSGSFNGGRLLFRP